MARRLPSLNALRAFEAAARHGSFTKAAAELNVTQGAVSHQVKALEADLGVALFRRLHQKLALTQAGEGYLPSVREGFDRLEAGTAELLARERSNLLTVSMSPNFAAKWFVHRFGGFTEQHPGIELRITPSIERVDFQGDHVDVAIRHGDGRWPELQVTRLCGEELFPVCSPRLLEGGAPLREPADLRHYTLLHDEGWQDWPIWLEAAGVRGLDTAKGPVLAYKSLAIDAACEGRGIALARTMLATTDLLSGRLIRPFMLALPAPYAYHIVCPKHAAERRKIVAFREWITAEAASDLARLAALVPGPR